MTQLPPIDTLEMFSTDLRIETDLTHVCDRDRIGRTARQLIGWSMIDHYSDGMPDAGKLQEAAHVVICNNIQHLIAMCGCPSRYGLTPAAERKRFTGRIVDALMREADHNRNVEWHEQLIRQSVVVAYLEEYEHRDDCRGRHETRLAVTVMTPTAAA